MKRILSIITVLIICISICPVNISYALNSACDFSDGLPSELQLYLNDKCTATTEVDAKSGSMALKIVKGDSTNDSALHYRFPKVTKGKVKSEFDFRFENNSKNVVALGNFLAFNVWKRPGNFCQRTNSLWHNSNAWLFVMEKPDEYFHFEQSFNFSTREYEYNISQNNTILYEYYTVNTDEKLTYLDSIFFNIKDQPGLNGPDEGDGILWVDNISVGYADAKVSGFSCDGVLSPYEDSVTIEFDSLLKIADFSEYIEIKRNGEILDTEKYELSYSEKNGTEGTYNTKRGQINIKFIKEDNFYNSEYVVTVKDGIPTEYDGITKGDSFKFNVPDCMEIYSAEIKDEFGRKLLHMADAAGKEVTLSVVCHDVNNKGFFAAVAIKDGDGRLVKVNTMGEDGDIKISIPQEANALWYMELYIFDSDKTIKPYREKKICFKEKIIEGKSLSEALEMAKEVEGDYTGITVLFNEGDYRIDDTVVIDEKFPMPLEITTLSGEAINFDNRIKLGDALEITDNEILERVNENVLCYNLEEFGIDKLKPYGQSYSLEISDLLVCSEDNLMKLARYPNDGYLTIRQVKDNGYFSSTNENDANNRGATFEFSGADTSRWKDKSDIWMFGYPQHTWQHLFIKLKDISDTSVTTYHPGKNGFFWGQGFYFVNVLEELDAPGEYYIDRDSKKLYVYRSDKDISITEYSKPFLRIEGASDITFKNVNFYGTRSSGIDVNNSRNIDFDGCEISCIGKYAVNMKNVTDCDFVNGEISYCGTSGIKIESGDKSTMKSCNNKITNNKIHDFGYFETTYNPGVLINSIGDEISHNEIYNCDHMAISAYGNNNIYEYNDIHDVLRYTDDSGAIYTGRSWITGGNVFRYNYFHDMNKSLNSLTNNAIYLDDVMFNAIIYANIFENVETGVFVHGGRCNEVYSNVFINVSNPVDVVHVYSTDTLGTIVANAYVALLNKAFSDAFPNLVKTIGDENSEPKYNKAYNNALIDSGEVTFDETAAPSATIENNKIADKSIFNGNSYEINENSSVHSLIPGFLDIDFDKVGNRGM